MRGDTLVRHRGSNTNRPLLDGSQRVHYIRRDKHGRVLPPVRWVTEDGLVHVANSHSNHALCEMLNPSDTLLTLLIVEATTSPATCVACITWPTWARLG